MTDSLSVEAFLPQLGAFARIFHEATAEALADRFVASGLTQMQFNFSALGLPALPDRDLVASLDLAGMASAFQSRGVRLWGVSSTYNMAHPDAGVRKEQTARAAGYIAELGPLEAEAVTLCTGTRDPDNMWRRHPDNGTEAAWTDFRRSLDALLPAAEEAGLKLAIEPEPGNVLTGTRQALRLVDELGAGADRIGFILDAANLVGDTPEKDHRSILEEAFAALGSRALCLHGKDPAGWAAVLGGQPGLDHAMVLDLYRTLPRPLPYILQDTSIEQLSQVRQYIIDAFSKGLDA